MCVIPENVKAMWTKVNSIGNSALYCSKKFKGNSRKGKVTIIKRKCYVTGRCTDTVNVNIGPVYRCLLYVWWESRDPS